MDCALDVLAIAAAPPQPTRCVQRWVIRTPRPVRSTSILSEFAAILNERNGFLRRMGAGLRYGSKPSRSAARSRARRLSSAPHRAVHPVSVAQASHPRRRCRPSASTTRASRCSWWVMGVPARLAAHCSAASWLVSLSARCFASGPAPLLARRDKSRPNSDASSTPCCSAPPNPRPPAALVNHASTHQDPRSVGYYRPSTDSMSRVLVGRALRGRKCEG